MRKTINKKDQHGYLVSSGDINISPQTNEVFIDAFSAVLDGDSIDPELKTPTYMLSITCGQTSLLTMHHIPQSEVMRVAAWAEQYLAAFLERTEAKLNVESALIEQGFIL